MKRTRIFNLLVLGLVLAVVASGCKKKAVGVTDLGDRKYTPVTVGKGTTGDEERGNRVPVAETPSGVTPSNPNPAVPLDPNDPKAHPQPVGDWKALPHDREALKNESVHFDLDSATIKSSEQSKLDAVAAYMKANPTKLLEIEGHCDERGTEGYNLSLGERRALAAREALIAAGIGGERMKTISYGESRPADPGTGESAWRANRRDEFVVVSPE
jgi:peptidoglycan-associated lipoprotein